MNTNYVLIDAMQQICNARQIAMHVNARRFGLNKQIYKNSHTVLRVINIIFSILLEQVGQNVYHAISVIYGGMGM